MEIVEARDLTKIYRGGGRAGEVTALDHLSLSVQSGEIFGLLGPNGAGKTTFIKLLLSISHPSGGSATLFGRSLRDPTTKSRIGYLPENHRYPSYLTGEQVLDYFARLSMVSASERRQSIDRYLGLLDMEKWRKVKIKKYSKGMMQRIGLAQALLHNPDLIFLDEPTDGVDPIARKGIRDLLVQKKEEGKTIFVNSHLLSEVEMISDRVAILNKGKLVKHGTVKELTETRQEYLITLQQPLPEEMAADWRARRILVTEGERQIGIRVASVAALNDVIDTLRARRCEIVSLVPRKSTLEDLFIDVIRRENG